MALAHLLVTKTMALDHLVTKIMPLDHLLVTKVSLDHLPVTETTSQDHLLVIKKSCP